MTHNQITVQISVLDHFLHCGNKIVDPSRLIIGISFDVISESHFVTGIFIVLPAAICWTTFLGPFIFRDPCNVWIVPTKGGIFKPWTTIDTTRPIRKAISAGIERRQSRATTWKTTAVNVKLVKQPHIAA